MNPVVHFEMPAEDKNRIAAFYTKAFGWKTQMLGPDMNEYVLVTTTELDENGRPKSPGTINGGFYKKSVDMPAQYPSVVIGVGDIKEAMKKVTEAGGQVLDEPNGDTRLRPLRVVLRHRRQPCEYDATKY